MSDGYPSDWDKRRKKVYQRDNYECQNCGASGGSTGNVELHAHHIVPKSKGGTHQISNLKTLCRDCHNAIHGDSMAPSEQRTQREPEWSFPLPVEKYPYVVSDEVQLGNEITKTINLIEDFTENLEELAEYAKMFAMLSEEDEATRLKSKFQGVVKDVDDDLNKFDQVISDIRTILHSIEHEEPELQEKYQHLLNTSDDLQIAIMDHRDISIRVKEQRNIKQSDIVDLDMTKDELETVAEEYINTVEGVIQSLLRTIKEEVDSISEKCGPTINTQLDNCPVCDGRLYTKKFKDVADNYQLTFTRCEDCQTEWALAGDSMEVVHSSQNIEGVKLFTKPIKRMYKKGYRLPEDINQYRAVSKGFDNSRKKIVYVTSVLGLGIAGISYTTGSLLLFGVLIVCLLFVAKMIGDYYLQKTMEGKINKQPPSRS